MKLRIFNKWYAKIMGYFWLPCPLCGKDSGGHEWRDRKGLSSVIYTEPQSGKGICPDCTRAGLGQNYYGESK